MNTINSSSMVQMAMDGQSLYKASAQASIQKAEPVKSSEPLMGNRSEVAQNIEKSIEEIRKDSQQLQKMSEIIDGRTLQFNVNKELNTVVVRIIDQETKQIIREIPSEDIQKLKLRIRRALGNIYDELA